MVTSLMIAAFAAFAGVQEPAEADAMLANLQLGPSDDYELLLAVEPRAWARCAEACASSGTPLARIGELTEGPLLERVDAAGETHPIEPRGWDHFGAAG